MNKILAKFADYGIRYGLTLVIAGALYYLIMLFTDSSMFAIICSVVTATFARIIIMELIEKKQKKQNDIKRLP